MRLAAFFLCLYVWCLHLLFLPCGEIARDGGFFLCGETARDGGFFLATKSQGTVASLREIAGDGGGFFARNRKGR